MKTTWLKWGLPVAVLGVGVSAMMLVNKAADEEVEKEAADNRPVVNIQTLKSIDHQVTLSSYGEVVPMETTALAAQVSGEVTRWHPSFKAGGIVSRGELLFSLEKSRYEAAVLQAEAQLASAQALLIEEKAKADVAADEARRFPDVPRSALFLREPQVLSAEAGVKSALAELKRAKRDMQNTEVVAPYDALIVSRDVGVGQFVTAGQQVGRLNNIESAEIVIPVPGFDAGFLPRDVSNLVASIQLPGGLLSERQGKVDRDFGQVDSDTRMINLVISIDDPYGLETNLPKVKFGSYANVEFAGRVLEDVYRVPQTLVNNNVVWVLDNEDKLVAKQVEVLREEEKFFIIGSGLNEGDRIVSTLPEYPIDGLAVKIADAEEDTSTLAQAR